LGKTDRPSGGLENRLRCKSQSCIYDVSCTCVEPDSGGLPRRKTIQSF
jgi:hypothetical protein